MPSQNDWERRTAESQRRANEQRQEPHAAPFWGYVLIGLFLVGVWLLIALGIEAIANLIGGI